MLHLFTYTLYQHKYIVLELFFLYLRRNYQSTKLSFLIINHKNLDILAFISWIKRPNKSLHNILIHLFPSQVTGLDATQKVATLEDGHQIRFDKCLLATGAAPRNLPVFSDPQLAPRVTLYRGVEDFQRLESVIESGGGGKKVAVVGGGFLGSELSCALAKRGGESAWQLLLFIVQNSYIYV